MKQESVVVRYDGPALAGHRMDVGDLAPALFGLSELCKIANAKFNGDRAAVKVLIGVDQEQQCFQFNIDSVQTFMQHAQALLELKDVKTAKEILEWLGLLGIPAGGLLGLLGAMKRLDGKSISSATLTQTSGRDSVQIVVAGDNNTFYMYPQAFDMLKDAEALTNAKKIIAPITKEGYERLDFERDRVVTESFTRREAKRILDFGPPEAPEKDVGDPQVITAYVKVYAPVYDPKAKSWRFMFAGGHPYIDISETDIAKQAIGRGGAMMDDTYEVKLEIQQTEKSNGEPSARYKIKEVINFKPARISCAA